MVLLMILDIALMECSDLAWNPVEAAASHSQYAGVLGGFILAMIIMRFDRLKRGSNDPVLLVLLATLVLLGTDSFVFSIITGARDCGSAWVSTLVASCMLGIGSLGTLAALRWLFSSGPAGAVFRLAGELVHLAAFMITLRMWETIDDFSRDVAARGVATGWWESTSTIYLLAMLAGIIGVRIGQWVRRPKRRHSSGHPEFAAYLIAGTTALLFLTLSVLFGPLFEDRVQEWTLTATTFVVLILFAVATLGILASLPVAAAEPALSAPNPPAEDLGREPASRLKPLAATELTISGGVATQPSGELPTQRSREEEPTISEESEN